MEVSRADALFGDGAGVDALGGGTLGWRGVSACGWRLFSGCCFCVGACSAGDGSVGLLLLVVEAVVEPFVEGGVRAHVDGWAGTRHFAMSLGGTKEGCGELQMT